VKGIVGRGGGRMGKKRGKKCWVGSFSGKRGGKNFEFKGCKGTLEGRWIKGEIRLKGVILPWAGGKRKKKERQHLGVVKGGLCLREVQQKKASLKCQGRWRLRTVAWGKNWGGRVLKKIMGEEV